MPRAFLSNSLIRRAFRTGACLALLAGGCRSSAEVSGPDGRDIPGPQLPLSPAIVSDARAQIAAHAGFAFVALAPQTIPTGRQATISNPTNGAQTVVMMRDGGWDPVAIAASAGDTLRITIQTTQGENLAYVHPVPPSRPPMILRTEPPPRKRDVPLNASIVVVFSEPIDPASITPQRVQLLQNGQPVEAGIEVSPDGLRMSIQPRRELEAGTAYSLVISPDLADLTGEHLEQGAEVEFRTVVAVNAEILSLSFVRGTTIFDSLPGGSAVVLVQNGTRPAWSPDGSRLAFTRPSDLSLAKWELCITLADGSDPRCAAGTTSGIVQGGNVYGGPSWSPDGKSVAFSVFEHSCPGGDCGQFGGYFTRVMVVNASTMQVQELATPRARSVSWSPDGNRLAVAVFDPPAFGELGIVNADGSGYETLPAVLGSYSVIDVVWSPDGGKLALRLWDNSVCPWLCDSAIGIVDADGTHLRVFDRASTAAQDYFQTPPAWSPDGARLAYTISRGDGCYPHHMMCNDIKVVDVAIGQVSLLVSAAAYPAWRPRNR